mmetsp:Transcript_95165/g.297599  ORF Transcript_95165/g.297599 Transcript_95165/m.297599 type:complete len:476 (+) Transcript_95165:73-1500(+)
MPATAGRVPMPNDNRLSVSDSLKTHDVWQKSVGYDPYAGLDEGGAAALPEVGEINSSAKGLFRLAQLTGNSSTLAPGACKKCGQVGHLFFQCRNTMSMSGKMQAQVEEEEDEEEDYDPFSGDGPGPSPPTQAAQASAPPLGGLRPGGAAGGGQPEALEEEDDDDADAMVDTDAAARKAHGKKMRRLRRLHRTLFFARQLQVPDWMCEVPEDLASSWLLLVKPEGDRCLLLSDGGRVEVRRKNGYVLERFSDSRLPRGLTILDVVCMEGAPATGMQTTPAEEAGIEVAEAQPEEPAACDDEPQDPGVVDVDMGGSAPSRGRGEGRGKGGPGRGGTKGGGKGRKGRPKGDRKYAVMDVLVWGDVDLASADAECRMFWLESRFSEISEKRDSSQNMRHSASAEARSTSPQTKTSITAYFRSPFGRPFRPLPPPLVPPLPGPPLPRPSPRPRLGALPPMSTSTTPGSCGSSSQAAGSSG